MGGCQSNNGCKGGNSFRGKAAAPQNKKVLRFTLGDLLKPDQMSFVRHNSALSQGSISLVGVDTPVGAVVPKTTPIVAPHHYLATFSSTNSKTDVDALMHVESGVVSDSTKVKLVGTATENTTIKVNGKTYLIKAEYDIEAMGIPFEKAEDREKSDLRHIVSPTITNTRNVYLNKNGVEQVVKSYSYKPTTGKCKVVYGSGSQ